MLDGTLARVGTDVLEEDAFFVYIYQLMTYTESRAVRCNLLVVHLLRCVGRSKVAEDTHARIENRWNQSQYVSLWSGILAPSKGCDKRVPFRRIIVFLSLVAFAHFSAYLRPFDCF